MRSVAIRWFGYAETVTERYTVRVWRRVVRRVNGKRVVIRVRQLVERTRVVPSPALADLLAHADAWHRVAPPEYQGSC